MSKINSKIENVYRLSPLQEGMLYYNLVDNSSSAYSLQNLLSVKYNMDHDILKQALSLLSERFSVLRTAFVYEGMKEILKSLIESGDSLSELSKKTGKTIKELKKILND